MSDLLTSSLNGRYAIGSCIVERGLNRIERDGQTLSVEPKVMQVLSCLVEHPDEVVSKDVLIDTVWGEAIVSDDVLARAISALRKAFDDNPRDAKYIETIRKKGYRLVAPVHAAPPLEATPQPPPFLSTPALNDPSDQEASQQSFILRRWFVGVLLVVFLGIIVFAWLPMSTPQLPSWPPLQSVPLTAGIGLEITPNLSPQGDYVVYAASDTPDGPADIFVQLLDGGAPHQLVHHPAPETAPAWSPDGNYVAFMRHEGTSCAVFVIPLIGGMERKLGSCGDNRFADLAWSPDGEWLAFNSRDTNEEAFAIYLLSADGSIRTRLTSPDPSIWGDYDPAFAPDSRSLVFARSLSEGLQDLYVISLEGSNEERLTTIGRNLYGLTWMPDNRTVLFSSNQGGTYDIWQMDIHTRRQQRVYAAPLDQVNPTWHAETQRLVVEQRQYDMNIRSWSPNGTTRLLAPSTAWDLHPQLSPDGSRLAFTSNRSGSYEIWVAMQDGTQPLQLTTFQGPFTGTPRWSPDGTAVTFDARPEGHADIYLTTLDAPSPQRLTAHPADDMASSWSRDGHWIYFASNRTGAWEVWKKAVSSAQAPVQVTENGGFQAYESSDGTQLLYTKHPHDGIWAMPLAGGAETQLIDDLMTSDWGNWAVTASGVYYTQRPLGERYTPIAFYDFQTRQTRIVHRASDYIPTQDPAFAITPNTEHLIYGLVDQRASDLLLLTPLESPFP